MEKIKIAIIGYGTMGKIRYNYLKKLDSIEIILVYDPYSKDIPEHLKTNLELDQVIGLASIDAIFICTPNYLNAKLTFDSLKNEKHVFCEKPPSMNSLELKKVVNLDENSSMKLMYGFNHRHHDSIKKMHNLIKNEEYGKILWMRGRYGKSVDENFKKNWRSTLNKSGGGILLDQGIHMLDLFLYFAEDFDEVKSYVSNLYWKMDIEDNVFAIYKNNKTGLVASLHSTMTQWRHLFSIEVFLEGGYMVLNGLKTSSGTYGEEKLSIAKNRSVAPAATWKDEEHHIYNINNSWEYEIDQFIDSILNDKKIKVGNSTDAYNLMRLIDMTYENSEKNK